ncbi:MAG: hypothetical protein MJZ38_00890 [archaeon]|nr:hypothetical protein [archaeon]
MTMLVAAIAVMACVSLVSTYSDADASDEYKFYLINTVDGEDSTINGWYTATGDSPVAALCNALETAKIPYSGFTSSDSSIYFGDKMISDWSKGAWASDGAYYGANFSIWNYNVEDGWHLGNTFGTDCTPTYQPAHKSAMKDRAFIISHERYVDVDGTAAPYLGISNVGVWPDATEYDLIYDGTTGGYADATAAARAWYKETYGFGDAEDYGLSLDPESEDYDDADDALLTWMADIDIPAYSAVPGWNISNAQYGYASQAPVDLEATPENVKFGINTYTFILNNSVEGEDSTINGTYTGRGVNAIFGLYNALNNAGVPNTIIPETESFWFTSGTISDWSSNWDMSAEDVLGANYAVWNYSAEKGWFTGNTLGSDPETTYLISHENYYVRDGMSAFLLGVFQDGKGEYYAPAGYKVIPGEYGYLQMAPVDLKATPDKIVLGSTVNEYNFYLINSVEGQDSTINGWYTGYGSNPVEALKMALEIVEIPNAIVYTDASVWFKTGVISNWSSAWDSSATDILGANFAVWNYNEKDGWFTGNTFGKDSDTTYIISHENYLQPAGATAQKLGVKVSGETITCPAGLRDSYGMYIQYAPLDLKTTPDKIADTFGKIAGVDYEASIEVDGVVTYYETLVAANNASSGTDMKLLSSLTLSSSLTLKKNLEIVSGVELTLGNGLTVAAGKTLAIDDGASILLSVYGKTLANKGSIVNNGAITITKGSYSVTNGTFTGNAIVTLPFFELGDTVNITNGTGSPVHNKGSDTGVYDADSKVTMTFKIESQPAAGETNWDNCGTAVLDTITFQDKAKVVYIPSYIVTKHSFEGKVVYSQYKVASISEAAMSAINGKELTVVLPQALRGLAFGEKVVLCNVSDFVDELGNKVTYEITETSPSWFNGNTTYYEYANNLEGDNRFCELGKILCVELADGQTEYSLRSVKWSKNVCATNDHIVSAVSDIVMSVMIADETREYTFILNNTVSGEDSEINGTYTGIGTTPVSALYAALTSAGIKNNLDPSAASVWFTDGSISDWSSVWDSSASDCLGANYAIWNYSAEKGWFIGNTFGTDPETTYYISHENYYVPTGTTAASLGVSGQNGKYCAPNGLVVTYGMYVQMAPRDVAATPENVVFGVDLDSLDTYTFILKNSVTGEDSEINGTYTGLGATPVQGLVTALNLAGIAHTLDYGAASAWFRTGSISDWTSVWDSSAEECIGANFAVWNYNEKDGWFIGNTFGTDSDLVYLISHENYYAPSGEIAKAMGVTESEGVYTAPAGLVVSWNSYVQTAPMDASATPDKLVFEPHYVITVDPENGTGVLFIAKIAGSNVVAPADPVKADYEFLGWMPAFPTTMPAQDMIIIANWGVIPVIEDDKVEVVLGESDFSFRMPTSVAGMATEVVMPTSTVVIEDSTSLAGKTVFSVIDKTVNPTTVKGTAYEFTLEADGVPYNGKMTVTVPYDVQFGKVPVVYFVDGSNLVKMNVVSFTEDSVTFETDHNSLYVVSADSASTTGNLTYVVAVFVAVVIIALVAMIVADRKKDSNL